MSKTIKFELIGTQDGDFLRAWKERNSWEALKPNLLSNPNNNGERMTIDGVTIFITTETVPTVERIKRGYTKRVNKIK